MCDGWLAGGAYMHGRLQASALSVAPPDPVAVAAEEAAQRRPGWFTLMRFACGCVVIWLSFYSAKVPTVKEDQGAVRVEVDSQEFQAAVRASVPAPLVVGAYKPQMRKTISSCTVTRAAAVLMSVLVGRS